jgi:hypothetical protein
METSAKHVASYEIATSAPAVKLVDSHALVSRSVIPSAGVERPSSWVTDRAREWIGRTGKGCDFTVSSNISNGNGS